MGDSIYYLHTGRVGIAVTKRQRVRILAVSARDGGVRVVETDLELGDGRTLHAYDTSANGADDRLAVFWHHGSLNVGAPPEPLFPAAEQLGIRWVSYDRPGYGDLLRARTGTWRRRPATPPPSPTLWASTGSRLWDIPTAVRTP